LIVFVIICHWFSPVAHAQRMICPPVEGLIHN
jgi:hypothetical protein